MSLFNPRTPAPAAAPQVPTQDPSLTAQQASAATTALRSPQTQTSVAGVANAYAQQQAAAKKRAAASALLG